MKGDTYVRGIFILIPLGVLATMIINLFKINKFIGYTILIGLIIGFILQNIIVEGWKMIFKDTIKLFKKTR